MSDNKDVINLTPLIEITSDKEQGTITSKHGTKEHHFSIMWIGRKPDALSYISAMLLMSTLPVYLIYIATHSGAVSLYVGIAAMIGFFHGLGMLILNRRHHEAIKKKSKKSQVKKIGKITLSMGVLMLIYCIAAMIFDITTAIYSGTSANSEFWMLIYYGFIGLYFLLLGSARAYRNKKDRLILHSTYFALDLSAAYGFLVLFYGCLVNYLDAWNAVLVIVGMIIAMMSGIYRLSMGMSLLVRGGLGQNIKAHKQVKPLLNYIDKHRIIFWISEIYTVALAISSYSLGSVSSAYLNVGHLYLVIAAIRLFTVFWCDLCDHRYKDDEVNREKRKSIPLFVAGTGMMLISFCFLSAIRFILNRDYVLGNTEELSAFLFVQAGFFFLLLIWNIYTMVQGNVKRDTFSVVIGALNILLSSITGFSTLLSVCAYFKGQFITGIAIFLFSLMLINFVFFTFSFLIGGYFRYKRSAAMERGYTLLK